MQNDTENEIGRSSSTPGTTPPPGTTSTPSTPSTYRTINEQYTPLLTDNTQTIFNIVDLAEVNKIATDRSFTTCQGAMFSEEHWEKFSRSRQLNVMNISHNIDANKTSGVYQFPVSAMDLVLKNRIPRSWVNPISEVPWFCKIDDRRYCSKQSY